MPRIIITVPEDQRMADVADYVRDVADQIKDGYLSGHVNAERHWTSEGVG